MKSSYHARTLTLLSLVAPPLSFAACAAGPGDAFNDVAADPALKHCAVDLQGETTCYATFNEAIAHATAGQLTDAVDADGKIEPAAFARRVDGIATRRTANVAGGGTSNAVGTTLIGVVYKAANFGTNEQTWTFFRPGNVGCDGNLNTSEFSVENLNTSPYTVSDMNDEISSFIGFSGCSLVLWSNWFFDGDATNNGVPLPFMSYVGDNMNDRASSIAWF